MLQNGSLSLTPASPRPNRSRHTTTADPSTRDPGADMNLINLWSADPLPPQVPQTFVFFAGPVQTVRSSVLSGDLPSPMSLSDFLVPSPLLFQPVPWIYWCHWCHQLLGSASATSSCGSSVSPQASPPPAQYRAESPAELRPLGPCLHLGLSAADSAPTLHYLVSNQGPSALATPLGSLLHPDKPRSVIAQLPPRTSGHPAVPRPSTPSASNGLIPPSGFPVVLARSITPPRSARSPALASVTRANRFTWASRPSMSPGPSTSLLRRFLQSPWFHLRGLVSGCHPVLRPNLLPGCLRLPPPRADLFSRC